MEANETVVSSGSSKEQKKKAPRSRDGLWTVLITAVSGIVIAYITAQKVAPPAVDDALKVRDAQISDLAAKVKSSQSAVDALVAKVAESERAVARLDGKTKDSDGEIAALTGKARTLDQMLGQLHPRAVLDNFPGPDSMQSDVIVQRSFPSSGGDLLVSVSGSAGILDDEGRLIGLDVVIDGNSVGKCQVFCQIPKKHFPLVTRTFLIPATAVSANQHHVLMLRAIGNPHIDHNDYFTCTVLELPVAPAGGTS